MEDANTNGFVSIEEFEKFLDEYCKDGILPKIESDGLVNVILNLRHEDFLALSPDEASSYAFKLHSHCIFMRQSLDQHRSRAMWCEEILHRTVSKAWSSFPDFMKYEVRRQGAITQDTFATKVEKVRLYTYTVIHQLENKILHIKQMADNLENFARRKSYEHR